MGEGGEYTPSGCTYTKKFAALVFFNIKSKQIEKERFIKWIHEILNKQGIGYKLFLIPFTKSGICMDFIEFLSKSWERVLILNMHSYLISESCLYQSVDDLEKSDDFEIVIG